MRARTLLVWVAVGLIGLALAAGVTYAATQLSSQRIGLSAEPPSAGEELAPPHQAHTPGTTAPSSHPGIAPGATRPDDDDDDRGGEERGEGVTRRSDWDD